MINLTIYKYFSETLAIMPSYPDESVQDQTLEDFMPFAVLGPGAQVTVEGLLLLNLKRVNIIILHNTLKFINKLTS